MGRESARWYMLPGPIFLQAAEGQGVCECPGWYSGFLFSWEVTKSPPPLRWWGIPPTREGLLSNDLAISCGSRRRLSASSPCEAALTATLSNQGPCYPGSQDQEHQSEQIKVEAPSEHPLEPLGYQHFHSNDHQHHRE
jgi:hypothetical protein